jgi:hypothetical protein
MKEQCNTCETYGKERAQENLRRAGIVDGASVSPAKSQQL